MAAIVKTTNVLNLNFVDGADATTTWKLDNPRTDVTLSQISSAIADMWLSSGNTSIFVNSSGNELVRLKSAEREQVVKTVEQVL